MKSKTIYPVLAFCGLSILQISCSVDNDFVINDPKEINTDVTLFSDGATMPLGRSEKIHLEDAIKMSKDTSIREFLKKNDDGTYSLYKKGVYDLSGVIKQLDVKKLAEVDAFSFNNRFDFHVDLKDAGFASLQSAAPGIRTATTIKKSQTLQKSLEGIQIIGSDVISKFPSQIKRIVRLDLDGVNLKMNIEFGGLPVFTGASYMIDSIQITLPDFIETENGTNVVKINGAREVSNGQVIAFDPIALNALNDIDIEDRTQPVTGSVAIKYILEVTASSLPTSVSADISVAMNSVIGNSATPSKLKIAKAKANVEYEATDTSSINLGKMPDFLQGSGVNLALDPIFNLTLRSNFGVPTEGMMTITPVINGKELDEYVEIEEVRLPQSIDSKDTIETRYMVASAAHSPSDPGVIKLNENLSPLLRRIPDSFKIKVEAVVDQYSTSVLQPSANYVCRMDYVLDVPVRFGSGFNLSFNAKSELTEDAATFFKIGPVVLNIELVNTMTVGFDCTVTLLDKQGKEIALSEPVLLKVVAGDGSTENVQKFSPKLAVVDASAASFGHLNLKFKINPTPEADIKSDQFVEIKSLSITLPEGATFSQNK